MKKILLSVSAVVMAFQFSACNDSYPETAEELAKVSCELFKKGDIEGLSKYTAKKHMEGFNNTKKNLIKFLSDEDVKPMLAKTDCTVVTKTKSYRDGKITRYYFGEIRLFTEKVDGKWSLVHELSSVTQH